MAEPSADRQRLLQHSDLKDHQTYNSFRRIASPDNPHFLVVSSHPGAANVLSTVVKALPPEANLTVVAHKDVAYAFEDPELRLGKITSKLLTPANVLRFTGAHVGIAGFSTTPNAELAMTVGAEFPTAWIHDFPSGILPYYQNTLGLPPEWTPDHIFTAGDFGAIQERTNNALFDENSSSYNPRRVSIEITGNPYLDRFTKWDIPGTRDKVRDHFGIPQDRRVLLYMGVPGTSSPEGLEWLANASLQTGGANDQIIYGRHPREIRGLSPEDAAKRIEAYKSAASFLPNPLIDASDFDPHKTLGLSFNKSDSLIIASDVVNTTISSTGADAVYGGISSIHSFGDLLKGTEVPDFEAPPEVTLGASIAVSSREEMLRALGDLSAPSFREDLQARMGRFKPTPEATERVVERLLRIANGYRNTLASVS